MKCLHYLFVSFALGAFAFKQGNQKAYQDPDIAFANLENRFLDAYWRQYPSFSVLVGYGKYYDQLVIPSSASVASDIAFSKRWLDTLNQIGVNKLNDNNKISLKIIRNQLESDIWYRSVFKQQEWDASLYNISAECDYILNQPYAPLDERLSILANHLQHADEYYDAALHMLHRPTREHVNLAIKQNKGGLSLFVTALPDSIRAAHLSDTDKLRLTENLEKTVKAINTYVESLKAIIADKNYGFRSFRIGKDLYMEKFKYDLTTDFTPAEIYTKALNDKRLYQQKMINLANVLWPKYYAGQTKPKDNIQLVQMIMDQIQLQHAAPKDLFDSLTSQVYRLKKFIIEKKLFDLDTTATPIIVRLMPEYARGFALANAEFTPPYQKQGNTYFNIDDVTQYPPEKAEGTLREHNNYSSQILSIHEAVPGHCVQSIYNKKNSPDIVRSVFANGAMIEGWAVYSEDMMIENGWSNGVPELELALYKWKLRVLANVLIDYDIQCGNAPKDSIVSFLLRECFQTNAQAEEKYNRATLSQVQLCSYYTGASAIHALRESYKNKMSKKYSLKDFHEKFLSFGSSPVKYIRERMLH
jgi:uncharacterized protein (DUF885 family)